MWELQQFWLYEVVKGMLLKTQQKERDEITYPFPN